MVMSKTFDRKNLVKKIFLLMLIATDINMRTMHFNLAIASVRMLPCEVGVDNLHERCLINIFVNRICKLARDLFPTDYGKYCQNE